MSEREIQEAIQDLESAVAFFKTPQQQESQKNQDLKNISKAQDFNHQNMRKDGSVTLYSFFPCSPDSLLLTSKKTGNAEISVGNQGVLKP